jgi:hypothetical protein
LQATGQQSYEPESLVPHLFSSNLLNQTNQGPTAGP